MNVYKLTADGISGYDCAYGFVVIAADGADARQMAADMCGDEGEAHWLNDARIELIGIAVVADAQVVLRDFLAG